MQRFLVTGGAGFIGSHLADALLAAGAAVRVLDDFSTGRRENLDPRCEVCVGDVADPEAVRTAFAGVDGCFHLAAIASVARGNEDWRGTHRTNQTGTVTVLEAARDAGRMPVVYASSAAVYGDLAGAVARETSPCVPLTAYGADKLGSELHARVAHRVHGVPTLGLRFFNVYGPRQDPASPYSGVVSIFAARLARGETLSVHGDGRQTRDFVFVADVVAHLRAAMARLAPQGCRPGRHGGVQRLHRPRHQRAEPCRGARRTSGAPAAHRARAGARGRHPQLARRSRGGAGGAGGRGRNRDRRGARRNAGVPSRA